MRTAVGDSAGFGLRFSSRNDEFRPAVGKGPKAPRASVMIPQAPVACSIVPFGSPFPKFNPPPGFQLRLGAAQTDEFLSGTFQAGGSTIGFIRIPSFEPSDAGAALQQFQTETAYFQQDTTALVIDLMGNGGGQICYMNQVLQYLFPSGFPSIGLAPMGTERWVAYYLDPNRDYWTTVGGRSSMRLTPNSLNRRRKRSRIILWPRQ